MDGYLDRLSRTFSDHRVQLVTAAVAASAATASAMWGTRHIRQRQRARKLKQESIDMLSMDDSTVFGGDSMIQPAPIPEKSPVVTKHTPVSLTPNEESLIREQLARHYAFLGDDGMKKLRDSFVVVVGAGGVGSWAALMLLRSGVQRMRIIDFDQVTLSSLNRHAAATRSTVGISKVDALQANFADIAPHAKIDARVSLFNADNADELLGGEPDYVLDCIDNMDTKLDLIMYCKKHNLPVISAMGAGMKSDPSRVQIADIGDTFEDPMSRAVRRKLKKMGVENGVKVIYSTEKPGKVGLVSLAESQQEQPGDFSVLPDFRVRIVPVLGTMPAMFGIAMGTHILTELAGFPTDPLAIKGRNALYARMQRELGNREVKISQNGGQHQLWMTPDDVGYVLEEIWRGRSAISGNTDKLALVRWKRDLPMTTHNCVVMTKKEADEHEKIEGNPEDAYPANIVAFINERFEEEKRLSQSR